MKCGHEVECETCGEIGCPVEGCPNYDVHFRGLEPASLVRGLAHAEPATDERYWIAYNGWMGNGSVGVIVKAARREEAILAAEQALRYAVPVHEASYFEIRTIHEITLPYVGEID